MGDVDAQLVELATPGLAPGESILATARLNYNGTQTPNTITIQSGLAALGGAPDEDPDPAKLITFPVANSMAVVLTEGRLLVWGTGMRGKPKAYVGAMELTGVESVEDRPGRQGLQVSVHMRSGARVDLESVRGEDLEPFVAALRAALDGAPPPTAD